MSVECLLKNVTHTVGEGPHWEESTQTLHYVDIQSGDLHRWNSVTGKDEVMHFDDDVSLVVPCSKGGYLISVGRTLCHFDWETKQTKVLTEAELKGTKNRFNDGKCDSKGRLWAGTMGYEDKSGNIEMEIGHLYSFDLEGKLKSHLDKLCISNGLCWTEDNKTMYFIDSIPRKVFAFDYNEENCEISNQRVAVDFAKDPDLGGPDGMTIDTEGMIWVACYKGAKVVRFDPKTGNLLRSIPIPALRVTSCCFGGKDYDELYVTCATQDADEAEFSKYPLTGSVFKVTGLGVKGFPPNNYEGAV